MSPRRGPPGVTSAMDSIPRILLVEDNADDRALALRALAAGHPDVEVVTASDGVEALELLQPAPAPGAAAPRLPALVLLDLKLPRVDGIEVLRRLKSDRRTRRVPVVVLTSSDEARDIEACYAHGANSYLRKPVDYRQFRDTIAQVERYWLTLNVTAP